MRKSKWGLKVLRVFWYKINARQAKFPDIYIAPFTVTARERGKGLYQQKPLWVSKIGSLMQESSCTSDGEVENQIKTHELLRWTNSKVRHYHLLSGRRWYSWCLKCWDHPSRARIMVGLSARRWNHKGNVATARETTKGRGGGRGSRPWILPEALAV